MTRTELKSKANILMRGTYWPMEQVNNCKCWVVWSPDESLAIIQSYQQAVAIYSSKSKRLYVFDYYSTTTQQHIRKAAKIVYAEEIRYLYRRILENDWGMYIEDECSWNY